MREAAGSRSRTAFRIREARAVDELRVVAIGNAVFPEYAETLEEFRDERARLREGGYTSVLTVAEEPGGQIVGYSHFRHVPWQFDPTRFQVVVFVDPAFRRQGAGSALYAGMLRALVGHGARALESFAPETMPESIAFLERRGFRETMRAWEARLAVEGFDASWFAASAGRLREAGIVITTLAEEMGRDADALHRAHRLHEMVLADVPATIPYTPVPFEHFVRTNVESPRALLDAYFIAKDGDAYVGVANLRRPEQGAHLYHAVTGVLEPYRGRGIAVALKLATIAYARAHGFEEIRTWNETNNNRMIAINERLGFRRQHAWLTFERDLDPTTVVARGDA